MKGLGRFWRSVRHTRRSQLAARLRLMAKRRALERTGPYPPGAARALAGDPPGPAKDPPRPLFAPRAALAREAGGRIELSILGQRRALESPMDWHPPEWKTGTRLRLLHLHGMEFLEALEDDAFLAAVLDWIGRNPPYRRGYWLDSWNAWALSIRCATWMGELARRGGLLDRPEAETVLRSLAAQMRFLESNLELDIGGNHVVKDLKALLWAGRFFAGREAERWTRLGERLLARALEEQVLPDGMHFELSPAYHAQVFADLLECRPLVERRALRADLARALDRMAQVLCDLTHPDGGISLFGDGGLEMARSTPELLALHARLGGREPAPRPLFALESAGYYGLRDGGELLIADCGAIAPDHLPAHGHADALAFEWSAGGKRIIVDAGVHEYDAGPERDLSRSARAHNTVTVGDADQAELYASFRLGRRPRVRRHRYDILGRSFVLEGSHDGFARLPGAPRHQRRIAAARGCLRVADTIHGGAGQSACARLLLHPEVRIERTDTGLVLSRGEVAVTLETTAEIALLDAHWCPDFYRRHRTRQVVLRYGPAPCAAGFELKVGRAVGSGPAPCPAPSAAAIPAVEADLQASARPASPATREPSSPAPDGG